VTTATMPKGRPGAFGVATVASGDLCLKYPPLPAGRDGGWASTQPLDRQDGGPLLHPTSPMHPGRNPGAERAEGLRAGLSPREAYSPVACAGAGLPSRGLPSRGLPSRGLPSRRRRSPVVPVGADEAPGAHDEAPGAHDEAPGAHDEAPGAQAAGPAGEAARDPGPLELTGGSTSGTAPRQPQFAHSPVMVGEVVQLFAGVPDGVVLDATVGGAGHSRALLEASPQRRLVALDRDPEAVAAARVALAPFGDRAAVVKARFDELAGVLAGLGSPPLLGALFDLGVSSPQFDEPGRGFSYRFDAPLDMRMDPTQGRTAAELIATSSTAQLARLFAEHGEERFGQRIAAAVFAARPTTTGELADVVASAVPAAVRRRGHPAKRVFQALRVAVNDELDVLPLALAAALDELAPGGVIVVISYHSGEDRLVKQAFRQASRGGCTCPAGLPCVCGAEPAVRLLTRGSRKPSAAELAANPRSASARLRSAQKLAPPAGGAGAGPSHTHRRSQP